MKRVAVITASDKGYKGEREDLSGPAVKEIVEAAGYQVVSMDILPDDREMLGARMAEIADLGLAELILTTAGIRKGTLIVNLPGSPKAVRECLEVIIEALGHGIGVVLGRIALRDEEFADVVPRIGPRFLILRAVERRASVVEHRDIFAQVALLPLLHEFVSREIPSVAAGHKVRVAGAHVGREP